MKRHVKIWVSGRVQGVFFRQSTKNKARELGVFGKVKNLEDGRVEIIVQAEDTQLQPFLDWCRKGPITARVDHIDIIELGEITESYISFQID
ncbi:MAG: acylphosphatase [Methylococcaceae bacterium]|nr:acylphosphatase [Methylococcaceae bacterium]